MSNPNITKINSDEIRVAHNSNRYVSNRNNSNTDISGDTRVLDKNELDEQTFKKMQQRSARPRSSGQRSSHGHPQRESSRYEENRRPQRPVNRSQSNNQRTPQRDRRSDYPRKKQKKLLPVIIAIAAIIIIGIVILIIGKSSLKGVESPVPIVSAYLDSISCAISEGTTETSTDTTGDTTTDTPVISEGYVLGSVKNFELDEDYSTFFKTGTVTGTADCVNLDKISENLADEMNLALAAIVDEAGRASDVYNEDDTYKDSAKTAAFNRVMSERLNDSTYFENKKITIKLKYDGSWEIIGTNPFASAEDLKKAQDKMLSEVTPNLVYHEKHYSVPESSMSGYVPDQNCYGTTSDPNEVMNVINSKTAQKLLKGQTTAFSADTPIISEVNYYLDESILAIVWQEWYDGVVATYSECVLADGSQIKKKTEGDTAWGGLDVATNLAAQANAVYAVGGDFYNHDRSCGIVVISRNIYRFEPNTADTCFFTADGDMLFVKRGEFTDQSQAEQFVEENDIVFSLAFGPVLIENGQDVTPSYYQWGEINDTYARSAIGMLGNLHYLTVNLNNEPLATLQQATNAMMRYGCTKAYTLDGGQTACTIINGKLINPVQFGFERVVSDILFFATAVKN